MDIKGADRGRPTKRIEAVMTGLGAAIYIGFFVMAALWLCLTGRREDQAQRPLDSKFTSASAGADGFSPWPASHSLSK